MLFVDSGSSDFSLPLEVTNSVSAKSQNPLTTSFLHVLRNNTMDGGRRQESNTMSKAFTNILDPLHSRGDDNLELIEGMMG